MRNEGWKVSSIKEMGWTSEPDIAILKFATQNSPGIITQDIDFGELIFKHKQPFYALLRFWHGHFDSKI